MLLSEVEITSYRSIDDSNPVVIDPMVTVLVGQNESGKTAFLQALHKALPVDGDIEYDVTSDYPRKGLNAYEAVHDDSPAKVSKLKYTLEADEIDEINNGLGFKVVDKLTLTRTVNYKGESSITLDVPESQYVKHLISGSGLSSDLTSGLNVYSIRSLIGSLDKADLNAEGTTFLDNLKKKFGKSTWTNSLQWYVWNVYIWPRMPRFLYFDDYYLLPGKINLNQLKVRVNANSQSKVPIPNEDKTVLSLLKMAGIDLQTLTDSSGYEKVKARLEGISNSITDTVFEYWTQNKDLDVEFDLRSDPDDDPPFNNGTNLYIRIRNRRHRVTVPFSQRSKGFIWFFSFIVWFNSISQQASTNKDLVLLLDEPGLSLHALAQSDFLRYIDHLAEDHQIIYTTHSPFMVHSDRLSQVRTVEDHTTVGTKVSDNVSGSDPKTIFPLQAALGYTIAQNLFISRRNLLVEGVADLVYIQYFSNVLNTKGRPSLRDDITVIPVGGLDKLATFIALLHGNELEIAVLHDYENKPDPRLENLVREKLIRDKQVLTYAVFRDKAKGSASLASTDIEDLLSVSLYLKLFNAAYAKELNGIALSEGDLPAGQRIVIRITQYLKDSNIQLRASGGFNHYLIANYLAANPVPVSRIDKDTLERFEYLFETVNRLYSDTP